MSPDQIRSGHHDLELDELAQAIKERRKIIRQSVADRNRRTLKAGDTVVLHGLRPQRINGLTARIVRIDRTRALVHVENHPIAGRHGDQDVRVPLANLAIPSDTVPDDVGTLADES